jgi:GntR family transcriptional regulator, transcriptional repressor for pyruvate dehydrogenase complex
MTLLCPLPVGTPLSTVSPDRSASAGFSRLKVVPRSTQVREQLELAINSGEYGPGDRLPSERELSEMFGVSRVSVREALRSLEAIGLVQVRHGHGAFVLNPSERAERDLRRSVERNSEEALDLLLVRGALDELAAAETARRRDTDDLASIREAHERFASAASDKETPVSTLERLDVEFHTAVAHGSGSPLLANLLDDLHVHLADSRTLSFATKARVSRSAKEHAAILEAIAAGDEQAARKAVSAHLAQVRKVLKRAE